MEMSDLTGNYRAVVDRRALTQFVIAKAIGGQDASTVEQIRGRLATSPHRDLLIKAATTAILQGNAGLDALRPLRVAWADLIRKQTVLGRMAAATRRVPRLMPVTVVNTGTAAGFVTENQPIPVVRPVLTDFAPAPGKIARIVPYSAELRRLSDDRAAILIERDLSRAVATAEDAALFDAAAAVAGGRPASILNGLTALNADSPADLEGDVIALLAAVRGGSDAVSLFFVTSPAGARYLLGVREAGGPRLYPDVTATGGSIYGVPLLVSSGAPDVLALIDADAVLVVDEEVDLDMSTQASFQFDDAPSAGAQNSISLFQTDSIGIKVERWIGWRLAWADGAAYVNLPAVGSPA